MSNVRILVVDDSPLFRRVVTDLFAQEKSGFEVVGSAENGREALMQIHLLNPDLVILDVEMPVMNGWETLQAIKLTYPKMAVIIFSSLGPDAYGIAERARVLGARDFVPKPGNIESSESFWQHLCDNLLAKAKMHFECFS
jgi:two-component system chemotaxis response regulator CheB